jgi:hypothetical protein
MVEAGLEAVHHGFTRETFTAMIEGVRNSGIEAGLTVTEAFDAGVRDLPRTTEADGVFCYTFFKGVGRRGRRKVSVSKRRMIC